MTGIQDGIVITFYSYKGGTGRTMAVANVAWILASNGYRVLAVDWDLEAPGLHKFLQPFLEPSALVATPGVMDIVRDYVWAAVDKQERPSDWVHQQAEVTRHAVSAGWDHFPGEGALDFLSAGKQNRDYSAAVSSFDWDNFYAKLGGGKFLEAVRLDMKRNYDYVLIDSRTGLSDAADICTVQFPDVLVDCFSLSNQSIEGSASIANQIEKRFPQRKIQIFPVAMRVDDGEKEKVDAGRALARSKFRGFPNRMAPEEVEQYWQTVEIPYKPFYAFEEILATFGDSPGSPTSMLASFERLAAAITSGTVSHMPPMDEELRLRFLGSFTRSGPVNQGKIVITYSPPDRNWAEWANAVLGAAGYATSLHRAGPDAEIGSDLMNHIQSDGRVAAIISTSYLASPEGERVIRAVDFLDPSLTKNQLVLISAGEVTMPAYPSSRAIINVAGQPRDMAGATLLRAFGRVPQPGNSGRQRDIRLPTDTPRVSNLPVRNPGFMGRDGLLEELRDQLAGRAKAGGVPVVLFGLSGVGKSQIALEYAQRFKAGYDVVWWVPAADRDHINRALEDLAAAMGLGSGGSAADTVAGVLSVLRRGEPYDRWLLIFDGADDPGELEPYMPGGSGHVLITSLTRAWWHVARPVQVDVYTRQESVEHLLAKVAALDDVAAGQVAAALGDLPLAVEQAGAWLEQTGMPAATYVAQLESQSGAILSSRAPGYSASVTATWALSFERLQRESPGAARLLKLLAFFGSGPISGELIYNLTMVDCLAPYDDSVREMMHLGGLIEHLTRYALASVDPESRAIRVHQLVQAVVRSWMQADEQVTACEDVHRILIAARPDGNEAEAGSDDPDNWLAYDAIWPNLLPSRAIEHGNNDIRQLLVEWVRYQWKRGYFDSSLELAARLQAAWVARLGEVDPQILSLRFQTANVLRSQGRYAQAYELDSQVLHRQIEVLGPDHRASLRTAGSLAADLRALGKFKEALERDEGTYSSLKKLLGPDHPRTLAGANNLAVSCRLTGDSARARLLDEDTIARRIRVLGETHPYTLSSAASLARDMREAGEYENSVNLLRKTYQSLQQVLDDDAVDTLRTAASLAVALRKAGDLADAMRLSQQTYEKYLQRYSENNPDSLSCLLNLACDCAALGDKERARDLCYGVQEVYEGSLGEEHPYTLACKSNLSVYLRRTGSPEDSRELADKTLQALRRQLGEAHPFALSCAINLSNALSATGDLAGAETLGGQTLQIHRSRLGARHPETLICEAGLAATLHAVGRKEADDIRERLLSAVRESLGEDHPYMAAVGSWQRLDSEVETQPI